MKRMLWILPAVFLLTGCTGSMPKTPEEMPPIVFEATSHTPEDEQNQVFRSFFDRNGVYYAAWDADMCTMRLDDLIEAYENGELDEYKTEKSCDPAELFEMHKLLIALTREPDFALEYPDALPAVEAKSTTWYGIYYDADGNYAELRFHAHQQMTPIYGNDDRARTITTWWAQTLAPEQEKELPE